MQPSRSAHTVVFVQVRNAGVASLHDGGYVPLLIQWDGTIDRISLLYVRALAERGLSASTLYKHVQAIGLLHDFFVIANNAEALNPTKRLIFLEEFARARRRGTRPTTAKTDPTGLYWSAVSADTAKADLFRVSQYSKWCSTNFGLPELTHVELRFRKTLTEAYAHSMRLNNSALKHLGERRDNEDGRAYFYTVRLRGRDARGGRTRPGPYKAFPPSQLVDFFRAIPEQRADGAWNLAGIRDKLFFIFLAFGGSRMSEPLHLFVQDVRYDPKYHALRVFFFHPSDAPITWITDDGMRLTTLRIDYLRQRYNRLPRDLLKGSPEYAGWKGMLPNDERQKLSELFWINESLHGGEAWRLHLLYTKHVLSRLIKAEDHPYYFVSTDKDSFGAPVTLSNMRKRFAAICARADLQPDEGSGIHPHGMRHYYGYRLAVRHRCQIDIVREAMHHVSLESTYIYTRPHATDVRDEIAKAASAADSRLPFGGLSASELLDA